MPTEQDTEVTESVAPETEAVVVNGADGTTTDSSEAKTVEEQNQQVDPAEIERLRKEAGDALAKAEAAEAERNKATMRANQLENERKERDKADREKLRDGGEWETLAQQLLREKEERELTDAKRRQDELAEKEEQDRQTQVNSLRDEVLKDFPENVQNLAKKLDIWWDTTENVAAAQESLRAKLTDLKSSLPGEPAATHHANNPLGEPEPGFTEMSLEEMRKILPKAESR